jgi:hypothetical protein
MSFNDIDNDESTLSFNSETFTSDNSQKTAGRPFNPIWDHFNQIEKKKGGHYSASCKYCLQKWQRGDVSTFKMHIARNCSKAPLDAQLFYFKQLANDDESQKPNKKRKLNSNNNEDILKYVENQELPSKRQEQLENGMCLAFICAGISFNVAGNEIFRAWLQDLRPGFNIPSSKTLAGRIFNKQIIQVEAKIENELQTKNCITLGI